MNAGRQQTGSRPVRRTSNLHRGRVSAPGCRYFVTAVTKDRAPVLLRPEVACRVRATLLELDGPGDIQLLAATLMPDHVHLLFELGARLSLGRVCAKFKSLARDQRNADWYWQSDEFEHRLRPAEDLDRFGLYIFLNPYRAGLVATDARWPHWLCPRPELFRFMQLLREGNLPQPEWLGAWEALTRGLVVGE